VSLRITLATAARVLRQLRRDPRTLALVFVVPAFLLVLFRYVFDAQPATFDRVGGPMVGIFPLVSMFLVTSIAMLRERTTGTLERLMSLPLAKLDLLLGYGIAFALLAIVQAAIASAVAFGLLDLDVEGAIWLVFVFAVANALLGMAPRPLSLCVRRDGVPGRAVHAGRDPPAAPACGLLVPRDKMAPLLEWVSWALPMTYAYDGLARATSGETGARVAVDLAVVVGTILVALALGAATLRRRTP
jgi:ABC-2 type transport system permease protein